MLTDRQERFCQEYLIDLNATQAYIRAGYSARTAHNCASRLMAKAGVRTRIDELMAVRSRRTGVTQERVVRELARMLRVPKGTVTSRLHMARGRLRELLKEEIE